ncbi:DNA polymerase III subunit chi [Psychrobacter sp.]|uniref:DNA polymerase III subunit chi n=1 Tax=Psychrobacter sp. TaxID=56811 RepID=UPI003F9DE150
MKISFYVLSENRAQDFLGFICQLVQTALNRGSQSLLILTEDDEILSSLDEALWTQDATSFIPHQCLPSIDDNDTNVADNIALAPVLLGAYMPADFNGVVLNTTIHPVNHFMAATSNAHPTRVLEIIQPNDTSVQEGRNKYKSYQQLDYELNHFKV